MGSWVWRKPGDRHPMKEPSRFLGKHHTEESKKKISEANKGRPISESHKEKIRLFHIGKHPSEETREKLRVSHRGIVYGPPSKETLKKLSGQNSPNWRGGKSREKYGFDFRKQLKNKIRTRDDFLCQMPGCYLAENGKKHPVHHIDYNKNNARPENLITLCHAHHAQTVNGNREYWISLFQALQEIRHIGG